MRKKLALILVIAMVLAVFAGCGSSGNGNGSGGGEESSAAVSLFARHGRALTGESPEHAQIEGSV